MSGLADTFVRKVRRVLGLPDDPGQPPDLMRLGLYPAQVVAQNSDGTVDVQPADSRLPGEKNVTLLAPIPGAVVKLPPGAIVLLGWRGGDPAQRYCAPIWTPGASLTSLAIGNSPDNVVTKADITAIKLKRFLDELAA